MSSQLTIKKYMNSAINCWFNLLYVSTGLLSNNHFTFSISSNKASVRNILRISIPHSTDN